MGLIAISTCKKNQMKKISDNSIPHQDTDIPTTIVSEAIPVQEEEIELFSNQVYGIIIDTAKPVGSVETIELMSNQVYGLIPPHPPETRPDQAHGLFTSTTESVYEEVDDYYY